MATIESIKGFGKGAIENKRDRHDYRFELIAGAVVLPAEYSLSDKIDWIKDQNGSSSCVAQGISSYVELLNFIETGVHTHLSARDIYSLTFLSSGGAYSRDAYKKILDSGVVLEEYAPSYENGNPPSETFMRGRTDIDPTEVEQGRTYMAKSFLTWNIKNFEMCKQAIYQGNGATAVMRGSNAGWASKMISAPDTKDQIEWSHLIFMTGWKVIGGVEYIEFLNSWGSSWNGGFGYFPKSYIEKGFVVDGTTLLDVPNPTYVQLTSQVLNLKMTLIQIMLNKIQEIINKLLAKAGFGI